MSALMRPYMRGAVNAIPAKGVWPRSFAVSLDDDRGRRHRAEFTLHAEGTALFSIEQSRDAGMIDPPLVGWLSWADGEVVTAFRNLATGVQGGGVLAHAAPAEDGPFEAMTLDTTRWADLACELLRAAEDAARQAG